MEHRQTDRVRDWKMGKIEGYLLLILGVPTPKCRGTYLIAARLELSIN